MVVIRDTKSALLERFGKKFFNRVKDYSEVIGYTVEEDENEFKVEFNPDRPDLFSFAALEKAMKCFYDRDYWIYSKNSDSGIEFKIDENVRELRKFAIAFIAHGPEISTNLDSLIDYQERIHETIGKGRSKVSIGLHDLDKVKPPFEYLSANREKVNFTTYDGSVTGSAGEILAKHPKGVEYSHLIPSGTSVPVILDSEGDLLSMPPIVNGIKSRVEPATRRFFVDVTGNDSKVTRDAYYLLLYEFRNLGYTVKEVRIEGSAFTDLNAMTFDGRKISISQDEVKRTLGMSVSQGNAIDLLRTMGYMAEPSSLWVDVRVPGNRVDVMGEVDVIEDIVKAYGLSGVKEKKMDLPLIGTPDASNNFASLVRDAMVGIGLQEVRTFVVSSSHNLGKFTYGGGYEILNPKSLDYSVVRDRLYINILELFRINKRRPLPHKVFEIGEVYRNGVQETRFCAMIMDSRASYSTIRQVMDYVALRFGIGSVSVEQASQEGFIDGRTGTVIFDGIPVGFIGELNPELITDFDLAAPVAAMELDLAAIERLTV